jgi:NAD-dependent dihydropyrimidine dehydrogenase PreA subunit
VSNILGVLNLAIDLSKFINLFEAPDFSVPYLTFFVSEKEINLVNALNGEKLILSDAAARLNLTEEEALKLLEAAYLKSVLNKIEESEQTYYVNANFYEKLDYKCKFDADYFDIPKDVREELDHWCFAVYKEKMIPTINKIRQGEPVDTDKETFLLLDDLDEYLGGSKEFRVVPCNCRKLKQGCEKSIETCMRFNNSIDERTFGRTITKEEAKKIIINADKNGLMHTVNRDWKENGPTYMCNCCTTCCYPFRLVDDLELKGLWPQIQYVAHYHQELCSYCGMCIKRCMFAAFHHEDNKVEINGKKAKKIVYNAENCFGCGLCANTCPSKSITMKKLLIQD